MRGACRAQVAERSLFLWNNEYIVSLVAQQRGAVLPLVFAALERNAASHWNPAVHGLTCNVRKMFQDMDEQLYEECRLRYEAEEVRGLLMAVGGWRTQGTWQYAAVQCVEGAAMLRRSASGLHELFETACVLFRNPWSP